MPVDLFELSNCIPCYNWRQAAIFFSFSHFGYMSIHVRIKSATAVNSSTRKRYVAPRDRPDFRGFRLWDILFISFLLTSLFFLFLSFSLLLSLLLKSPSRLSTNLKMPVKQRDLYRFAANRKLWPKDFLWISLAEFSKCPFLSRKSLSNIREWSIAYALIAETWQVFPWIKSAKYKSIKL